MDVLGANRLQRVVCSKQPCGFSPMARAAAELPELQNRARDQRNCAGIPLLKNHGLIAKP